LKDENKKAIISLMKIYLFFALRIETF